MIKTAVPVAKPAAIKVAPAQNKAVVKVMPSVQPMQLAADTEQQNPVEGFFEPGPGKMAPSSPFQFKSTSSIIPTNHSPIQRKSSSTWAFQPKSVGANSNSPAPIQRAAAPANKTGLPDNVKSGVEQLSGVSLGDVKVHYNSPKPAQLQAHAYAQGTDIHVASGQEKHVPHEAWHVVQQKQGRVQATTQLKGTVPVNDDAGLEMEADVMGAKAVQMVAFENQMDLPKLSNISLASNDAPVQGMFEWLFGVGKTPNDGEQSLAAPAKDDAEGKGDSVIASAAKSVKGALGLDEEKNKIDRKNLQIDFVGRVTKAVGTIDWESLKKLSSYRDIMQKSASGLGKLADKAKGAAADTKTGLALKKGMALRKLGEKEKAGTQDDPASDISISVPDPTMKDLGNASEKQIMTGEQKTEITESLTGPLLGIMAAVNLLVNAKDLLDGKVKMDKLTAAKLLKDATTASVNGLKAAHGIIGLAGGPTIASFSSIVPGLGLVISSATIAIGLFQRWNAQEAVGDMEKQEEGFKDLAPYFNNKKLFFSESRGALLSWHDYYRVHPEALSELVSSASLTSEHQQSIISKYKKLNIVIPGGDIGAFVFRLNEYNLISKMKEINHKRIRHGAVAMASDIMVLAGNVAVLIPGGQVAAGILHGAAGTAKAVVAASVSMNKMLKGQNGFDGEKADAAKGAIGLRDNVSAVGGALMEESTVKHSEYVMHSKQVLEMYAKINPVSDSFESDIEKVEKIVNAAGVYPPAVYKEIDSDNAAGAYRSVHKLVGAMKGGR